MINDDDPIYEMKNPWKHPRDHDDTGKNNKQGAGKQHKIRDGRRGRGRGDRDRDRDRIGDRDRDRGIK